MTNIDELADAPETEEQRSAWLRCPVLMTAKFLWRFKGSIAFVSLTLFLVFETWTPAYWLSEAMYFEARDEPFAGRWGVANVVINRTEHVRWPDTIPAVIDDGRERGSACDMSYRCDGRSDNPWSHHYSKWDDWLAIRAEGWLIYGLYSIGLLPDVTCGAVYYKRHDVRSPWFAKEQKEGRMAPPVHTSTFGSRDNRLQKERKTASALLYPGVVFRYRQQPIPSVNFDLLSNSVMMDSRDVQKDRNRGRTRYVSCASTPWGWPRKWNGRDDRSVDLRTHSGIFAAPCCCRTQRVGKSI